MISRYCRPDTWYFKCHCRPAGSRAWLRDLMRSPWLETGDTSWHVVTNRTGSLLVTLLRWSSPPPVLQTSSHTLLLPPPSACLFWPNLLNDKHLQTHSNSASLRPGWVCCYACSLTSYITPSKHTLRQSSGSFIWSSFSWEEDCRSLTVGRWRYSEVTQQVSVVFSAKMFVTLALTKSLGTACQSQ